MNNLAGQKTLGPPVDAAAPIETDDSIDALGADDLKRQTR